MHAAGRGWIGAGLLGAATALIVAGTVGGCATHRAAPETRSSESLDLFGDAVPPVDETRARLPLSAVPPIVEAPSPSAAPQPSAAIAELLADAAEKRQARRFTEATLELERALRQHPDEATLHRALALTEWEAGNSTQARAPAEQAVARNTDDVTCQYILGRLAAARFARDESWQRFRSALLCSHDAGTLAFRRLTEYHLAESLAAEGYLAAALELYQAMHSGLADLDLAAHPNGELELLLRSSGASLEERLSLIAERLGRPAEAVEYLSAALRGQDPSPDLRRRYAKLLARAGRYTEAAEQARALLGTDPAALDILPVIYARLGTPQRLLDDLRGLLAERPADPTLALAYANALQKAGQEDAAVTFLTEAAARANQPPELVWGLFDLHRAHGRWAEALAVAADAVRTRPEWASEAAVKVQALADLPEVVPALAGLPAEQVAGDFAAAYLYGVLAVAAQAEDWGGECLRRAVQQRADFVPARVDLANVHLRRFDWPAALEVAAPEGVILAEDTRLETLVGRALLGLDRIDEAEAHLNAAVRLNRANSAARLGLADLYTLSGRMDSALRQLEALVKQDPANEEARERLFQAYLTLDQHRAAAEQVAELRRIAARPTRIARCVAAVEFNPAAPDFERLRTTLRTALAEYKPDADTLYFLGLSYYRERRLGEAIAELRRALELDPGHVPSGQLLIECHRANLDFEEALAIQRTMLGRYPNRREWKNSILDLLLILQHYRDALTWARDLLQEPNLDAGTLNAYRVTLARTHLQLKEYAEALGILEAWLQEDGDNEQIRIWMVDICREGGRLDQALSMVRAQYASAEGFQLEIDERLWAALERPVQDEFIQRFLQAIEDDPGNELIALRLIDLLRGSGRLAEAVELARGGMEGGVLVDEYRDQLYRTYARAERFDDALALLNQALAEAGGDHVQPGELVEPRVEMVDLLMHAGEAGKAQRLLTRWVDESQLEAEKLIYLRLLAGAHTEAGNNREAAEALTLALSLDPTDGGLNNDLGYTWSELGVNLERAEAMVKLAVAGSPRNGSYLDSLGWVLYKRGAFENAVRWLELARGAQEGDDPVICDHLGDAFWRLGRRDEARRTWEQSLAFAERRIAEDKRGSDVRLRTLVLAKLAAVDAGEPPAVAPLAEESGSPGPQGADPTTVEGVPGSAERLGP